MILPLVLLIILSGCKEEIKPSKIERLDTITYRVFRVDSGWGYDILVNSKVYIHQERIPSVQGKFVFMSEADARKTAILMINKMLTQPGLPYVSVEELDSLGVLYDTVKKLQEYVEKQMDQHYREYISKHRKR